METRKKAKYCGKTIRTIFSYISSTAVTSEEYNITEDYLEEICNELEKMLHEVQ